MKVNDLVNKSIRKDKRLTLKDLKVGDTVYIWDKSDSLIKTTKVESIEKHGNEDYIITYDNQCRAQCVSDSTKSSMGLYSCSVYFSKEVLKIEIKEYIKKLQSLVNNL